MKRRLLLFSALLLAACGQPSTYDTKNHTGCANGSIGPNGSCSVAEDTNAEVFAVPNLDEKVSAKRTMLNDVPGYLATPTTPGPHPSVVMLHEWWGLNGNIERMAKVLASEGYVVFAVDLYDGQVAEDSSLAGELSGQVRGNQEEAIAKMQAATDGLRDLEFTTDAVASLGWCFGGGQSLQLAISGERLDATVIYYGSLTDNKTQLDRIDWPVLGLFGSEDRVVATESVRAFNQSLNDLGIEHSVHIYEGAGHAFANPSGESFRPTATRDAWSRTLRFLEENLR